MSTGAAAEAALRPEWRIADRPVPYPEALAAMEARVEAMLAGTAGELVWLLEHPPLYTAGTSARPEDLLAPDRFPVFPSRRGGEYTYHGPGQRVAYAMLDLNARGRDVRAYVGRLEEWVIRALAAFGVRGERRAGRGGSAACSSNTEAASRRGFRLRALRPLSCSAHRGRAPGAPWSA